MGKRYFKKMEQFILQRTTVCMLIINRATRIPMRINQHHLKHTDTSHSDFHKGANSAEEGFPQARCKTK